MSLTSIRASVAAAKRVAVAHLVYVSDAHPAPAMQAYVAARVAGEAAIVEVPEIRRVQLDWRATPPLGWLSSARVP